MLVLHYVLLRVIPSTILIEGFVPSLKMSVELIKTPNVGYYPSEKDGLQFRSLGALETPNQGSLPSGFPVKLNSSLAWTRSEIAAEEDRWAIVLSSEEILAVEKALHHFKGIESSSEISADLLTS